MDGETECSDLCLFQTLSRFLGKINPKIFRDGGYCGKSRKGYFAITIVQPISGSCGTGFKLVRREEEIIFYCPAEKSVLRINERVKYEQFHDTEQAYYFSKCS